MSAFELTPMAEADLFQIWAYIAEDSPSAADRVEEAIYAACRFIAAAPHRGHTRRDLTGLDVRFWTLRRYPKLLHRVPAGYGTPSSSGGTSRQTRLSASAAGPLRARELNRLMPASYLSNYGN